MWIWLATGMSTAYGMAKLEFQVIVRHREDKHASCPLQWTTYTRMSHTVPLLCLFFVLILYLYVRLNDAKLMQLPHEVASAFSPKRLSARDALEAAAISERTTLDAKSFLPPKTGRRYIFV